jgi:hypothetical protein
MFIEFCCTFKSINLYDATMANKVEMSQNSFQDCLYLRPEIGFEIKDTRTLQ